MISARRGNDAKAEEAAGAISFHVIWNTMSSDQSAEKCAWFFQLQELFSTQLPKMPKEYITRIVFDPRHKSLALVKKGRLSISENLLCNCLKPARICLDVGLERATVV